MASSGVSYQESEEAVQLKPTVYQRIGVNGFEELSTLFYNRVFEDKESVWFLNIFASSSKAEAIENQVRIDYPSQHVMTSLSCHVISCYVRIC